MDDIYTKKPEECAYSFTQHTACEFFPCHKTGHPEDFNCLFCYCPLYTLGSKCGGNFRYLENGVKDCSDCLLPHGRGSYSYIKSKYPELMELAKKNLFQKRRLTPSLFSSLFQPQFVVALVAYVVHLIAKRCAGIALTRTALQPYGYHTRL